MSQDELLTGKAKKAKRSEERYKKGKKRSRDGAVKERADNLEGDQEGGDALAEGGDDAKESMDRGAGKGEADPADAPEAVEEKPKKRRKKAAAQPEALDGEEQSNQPSKHRYIVFIGNLPYSATDESLQKHFASISPQAIRHRTDPKTKKSKGFAFLEFASFDRMKTCLKTFHHSTFDSGIAKEKKRRINVELTAGGGGKGEARKDKVKKKNERLTGERQRRAEALAKEEARKAKKGEKRAGGGTDAEESTAKEEKTDEGGMHPSRLARLQGGR